MSEPPATVPEAAMPRLSRRTLLGSLAAASVAPWLLQGLPAQASSTVAASSVNPLPRQMHTATALGGGYVLVAGGLSQDGTAFSDVTIYGPTGALTAAAPMNTPRYAHEAVLLPYGKVLVLGGYWQGALDSAEIYDPSSNTWTPAASLALPRYNHTAVRLTGNQILVIGGSSQGVLSDTEIYLF
jgi:hypothetical protein